MNERYNWNQTFTNMIEFWNSDITLAGGQVVWCWGWYHTQWKNQYRTGQILEISQWDIRQISLDHMRIVYHCYHFKVWYDDTGHRNWPIRSLKLIKLDLEEILLCQKFILTKNQVLIENKIIITLFISYKSLLFLIM